MAKLVITIEEDEQDTGLDKLAVEINSLCEQAGYYGVDITYHE